LSMWQYRSRPPAVHDEPGSESGQTDKRPSNDPRFALTPA
jgi:hypothetical protein